jgi:AcrR family transcriptional regulator
MRNSTELKEGSKGGETRVRILAAALELFYEKGFEAATMRDIATRAGVATGAAYYYFPSKDAIVLAFYERSTDEMDPQLAEVLAGTHDLRKRLAGILAVKLRYFAPSRRLLTALAAHADPEHPLSPFSEQTREIRERDVAIFEQALSCSRTSVPDDLKDALPRLLWLYQMGLILFWIHDRSPGQQRTEQLIDKSLRLIVKLIGISGLPLMRPLRRKVLELYDIAK